jgi:hypothetical protein
VKALQQEVLDMSQASNVRGNDKFVSFSITHVSKGEEGLRVERKYYALKIMQR